MYILIDTRLHAADIHCIFSYDPSNSVGVREQEIHHRKSGRTRRERGAKYSSLCSFGRHEN